MGFRAILPYYKICITCTVITCYTKYTYNAYTSGVLPTVSAIEAIDKTGVCYKFAIPTCGV